MLLATLRFLAGGMKWDICLSLDIGFGSEIGLPLSDKEEMRKIADEFAGTCGNSSEQFWGCVMAIDGWVCATRKPYEGETEFPR